MTSAFFVVTSAILGVFVIFFAAFNALINDKYRQLQERLAEEVTKNIDLQSEIDSLKHTNETLKGQIAELNDHNKLLTDEANELVERNRKLVERVKELKAELINHEIPSEPEPVKAKDVFKTPTKIQRTPVITQIDVVW